MKTTELREKLENAYGLSTKPDPNKFPKYREGTVLDENMSVKWNKEQVAEANRKREEEVSRLQRVRSNAINETEKEIIKAIAEDVGVDEYKAKYIFKKAWSDGHSAGIYEVFTYIYDYIDFALEMLK
jgi:hypothetical protein